MACSPIVDVRKDRRAGSDRRALLRPRVGSTFQSLLGLQLAARRRRARIGVVDERHAVADEHVVLDRHAFADEGVARDLAARADRGVLLDFDERADLGLVADLAAVQVDELATA